MARYFRNSKTFDEFVLDIEKDDRGRLVAEMWHSKSGKTLAITEVASIAAAERWATELMKQQTATS